MNAFTLQVPLNFSSATTPALLLKTFDQYCEYASGRGGQVTLRPRGGRANPHKWLVVFCDEINLPAEDAYGTQRVISPSKNLANFSGFRSRSSPGSGAGAWQRISYGRIGADS